jgi:hypothetical protein
MIRRQRLLSLIERQGGSSSVSIIKGAHAQVDGLRAEGTFEDFWTSVLYYAISEHAKVIGLGVQVKDAQKRSSCTDCFDLTINKTNLGQSTKIIHRGGMNGLQHSRMN